MSRKIDIQNINLNVYDFCFYKDYNAISFFWDSNIGFGDYCIYKENNKWFARIESMDCNEDKDFGKLLFQLFVEKIEYDDTSSIFRFEKDYQNLVIIFEDISFPDDNSIEFLLKEEKSKKRKSIILRRKDRKIIMICEKEDFYKNKNILCSKSFINSFFEKIFIK